MKELVLCDKGIEAIRCAIVERAVNDFLQLASGELKAEPGCNIHELRAFFNGRLFASLCPESDPAWVLRELEKRVAVPVGAPPQEEANALPRLYVPVPAWLGDALISLREANSLRCVDLQRITGVSAGTISKIEHGATRTTAGILCTLSELVRTWDDKKDANLALLPRTGKIRRRVRNYRSNEPVAEEDRAAAAQGIKEIRKAHGVTFQELAKLTGLCYTTLRRIEKADRKITKGPIDALQQFLRKIEKHPEVLETLPSVIDARKMRNED